MEVEAASVAFLVAVLSGTDTTAYRIGYIGVGEREHRHDSRHGSARPAGQGTIADILENHDSDPGRCWTRRTGAGGLLHGGTSQTSLFTYGHQPDRRRQVKEGGRRRGTKTPNNTSNRRRK